MADHLEVRCCVKCESKRLDDLWTGTSFRFLDPFSKPVLIVGLILPQFQSGPLFFSILSLSIHEHFLPRDCNIIMDGPIRTSSFDLLAEFAYPCHATLLYFPMVIYYCHTDFQVIRVKLLSFLSFFFFYVNFVPVGNYRTLGDIFIFRTFNFNYVNY